jgi:PPOX class probable F420-dependent enzyme
MVELSAAVTALVEGPNNAHIATIMPDGSPHSVPVWVGMEGGHLAIQTSPGSRKARNIARDPRVAVSITLRDQPFTMAAIRGRVIGRLDGDGAWSIIDRLSIKHTGSRYQQRTDRVVFLIDVEHVSSIAL